MSNARKIALICIEYDDLFTNAQFRKKLKESLSQIKDRHKIKIGVTVDSSFHLGNQSVEKEIKKILDEEKITLDFIATTSSVSLVNIIPDVILESTAFFNPPAPEPIPHPFNRSRTLMTSIPFLIDKLAQCYLSKQNPSVSYIKYICPNAELAHALNAIEKTETAPAIKKEYFPFTPKQQENEDEISKVISSCIKTAEIVIEAQDIQQKAEESLSSLQGRIDNLETGIQFERNELYVLQDKVNDLNTGIQSILPPEPPFHRRSPMLFASLLGTGVIAAIALIIIGLIFLPYFGIGAAIASGLMAISNSFGIPALITYLGITTLSAEAFAVINATALGIGVAALWNVVVVGAKIGMMVDDCTESEINNEYELTSSLNVTTPHVNQALKNDDRLRNRRGIEQSSDYSDDELIELDDELIELEATTESEESDKNEVAAAYSEQREETLVEEKQLRAK